MRLAVTVMAPAAGRQADVVIDADPATVVADIASGLDHLLTGGAAPASAGAQVLRLPRAARGGNPGSGPGRSAGQAGTAPAMPAAPPLFAGGQEVPGDLTLAEAPIMDGSVVGIGDPAGPAPEPAGIAELRVAGGPAAGQRHQLPFGRFDVGSHLPGSDTTGTAITIGDPAIPPLALRVLVHPHGCQVMPYDGAQVLLEGRPLEGAASWPPGRQITVGGTLLDLVPYERPDAALRPAADGAGLEFNRPPRLLPPGESIRFTLPRPPAQPERRPVPVLMAIVPVLLGVVMAYLLHQVYMLALTAVSPVMLVGSYLSDRRQGRRSHARQLEDYRAHRARIEYDARAAVRAERLRRRHDCPDPATVMAIAAGPRRRLWERRRTDPDFLLLRAGTADLPSAAELTDPAADEHRRRRSWLIRDAPATIPLAERAVVGIAGPGDMPRAAGRWLAAQIAALHSPEDVQICVLTDSSGQDAWEWVRWLPHCRPAEGQHCTALIGNDAETVAARLAELQALVAARQKALRGGQARAGRDIVVVFDGSRKLRAMPGAVQILRNGGPAGVYCLCLDADERLLPAECHAVAAARDDGTLILQQMNQPAIGQVRPDHVTAAWAARLARSIAPIRDISGQSAGGLPDTCRLLDVLALQPPTAAAIAARWNTAGSSTRAVIGASYDGPFGIDLRRDGPHALIAGTTGAGKSELLQTLIVSLACANRPDAMTFVLIDYKGGSAFRDCVHLPHAAGLVTDLDTHLTQRALSSLTAELTRREQILAAAGAKDIDEYTAARPGARGRTRAPAGPGPRQPLPRLVIVIDEFATLVQELPGFVTGLVGIAQRGRSLGIHLILATQRPSGAVSADIRANTSLRIALRMTDTAESTDVIDAPDAGHIAQATPGRGYVRLGHACLVPFQAARVSGAAPGSTTAANRPHLTVASWADLGRPAPRRPAPAGGGRDPGNTDLTVLVTQIRRAAGTLGITAPPRPWLPALPRVLLLRDAAAPPHGQDPAGGSAAIVFGAEDLPAIQRQQPAAFQVGTFTHLMAAGAPGAGRSQLLRTIAASIAATCRSTDVHLYGIDCGNGALLPIAGLPHCGAVVTRAQTERAARLLTRLSGELERRHDLLAAGGFAQINEQRAAAPPAQRLPHIIVLLDRWEGFTTSFSERGGDALTDVITQILTEGASAGIHLVMTGDRSLLAGRIAALCEDKLAFRLPDKDDFALIGLRPRDLSDDIPPGRAFRAGTGTEIQVALLSPDPSGPGQVTALQRAAEQAAARAAALPGPLPFRVDVLPTRITFDDAWKLRPPAAGRPLWGLAGVGGDELTALGPDLSRGTPVFTVAGPAQSGRTAVLVSMAHSFLRGGTQLILVTPRPCPLRVLSAHPGAVRSFEAPGLGEEEFAAALTAVTGPAAVVIDDAELLAGCEASGELAKIIARAAGQSVALVLAGDAETLASGFGGWYVGARRARRGCLTAPQIPAEGELIGARLTRAHLGHPVRPGKALLHTGDGSLITVTVPSIPAP